MTAETLDDDISALSSGTESSGSDARREQLLSFIQTHEFVRIFDLARQFGVSEVTIRSDVDILARRGGIRRVRGGAMRVVEAVPEVDYEARVSSYLPEKRAIGLAAAAMLSPGDSVILDVGTTAMAIAHAIADREDLTNLTIFTPGLNIALALEREGDVEAGREDGEVGEVLAIGDGMRDRHRCGADIENDAVAGRQHRRSGQPDRALFGKIAGDTGLVIDFRHGLDHAHGAATYPSDATAPRQDIDIAADRDLGNAELPGEIKDADEFVGLDEGKELLAPRVGAGGFCARGEGTDVVVERFGRHRFGSSCFCIAQSETPNSQMLEGKYRIFDGNFNPP